MYQSGLKVWGWANLNNAAAALLVFAVGSMVLLGFYLMVPPTFTRIQANVTDVKTNATLQKAEGVSTVLGGAVIGWFPLVAAAIVIVAVVAAVTVYLMGRRS